MDSAAIYYEWEQLVIMHSVSGKNTYDARIVAAMTVHSISHLVIFNDQDFKRCQDITVMAPAEVIKAYPTEPAE